MSVNKVILLGRLGQDPELRYGQSGTAVCNFSLATSENWTDKASGKRQEKTEWHRIVALGRQAELCGQYLTKGRQVYIEGKIQTRSWDDKEGNKRYTTEVLLQNVQFISAGNGNGQTSDYAGEREGASSFQGGQTPSGSESFSNDRPAAKGGFALPQEDHFTMDDLPF